MARLQFSDVFLTNSDNTLQPKRRIKMGGVALGTEFVFRRGVAIAGVDLTQFIGRDLEVDTAQDPWIIKAIY